MPFFLKQEHAVIESKPDNKVEDLRLHKPWPELQRSVLNKIHLFCRWNGATLSSFGSGTRLQNFYPVSACSLHKLSAHVWVSEKTNFPLAVSTLFMVLNYIALCRFVDGFDIDTPDNNIHKHIPFAILLIKIADDWRKAHDGKLPANVREFKVRFRLPHCFYFLDIWQQQTG